MVNVLVPIADGELTVKVKSVYGALSAVLATRMNDEAPVPPTSNGLPKSATKHVVLPLASWHVKVQSTISVVRTISVALNSWPTHAIVLASVGVPTISTAEAAASIFGVPVLDNLPRTEKVAPMSAVRVTRNVISVSDACAEIEPADPPTTVGVPKSDANPVVPFTTPLMVALIEMTHFAFSFVACRTKDPGVDSPLHTIVDSVPGVPIRVIVYAPAANLTFTLLILTLAVMVNNAPAVDGAVTVNVNDEPSPFVGTAGLLGLLPSVIACAKSAADPVVSTPLVFGVIVHVAVSPARSFLVSLCGPTQLKVLVESGRPATTNSIFAPPVPPFVAPFVSWSSTAFPVAESLETMEKSAPAVVGAVTLKVCVSRLVALATAVTAVPPTMVPEMKSTARAVTAAVSDLEVMVHVTTSPVRTSSVPLSSPTHTMMDLAVGVPMILMPLYTFAAPLASTNPDVPTFPVMSIVDPSAVPATGVTSKTIVEPDFPPLCSLIPELVT